MNASELRRQFLFAKKMGWLPYFREEPYGVPAHLLMAIASRETNMNNIMGDGGHGHGLMQIDDRSFPEWCRSGKWKSVKEGIYMGAFVLRSKYNSAAKVPETMRMHVAVAMYNAGKHALSDWIIHADPDLRTTGRDYSRDVFARSKTFQALLEERHEETPRVIAASYVEPDDDGLWDRLVRLAGRWRSLG